MAPPAAEPVRLETQVLQQAVPETQVLQETAPETVVLGHNPPAPEEECGKTELLHPAQQIPFRFLVTETTLVIHTDEVI